jgi:ubiquinone/menaquinone biosynthesis C-methylase UbiE
MWPRSWAWTCPPLSFQEADGKGLPFPASTFDVVVLHTVLTPVPGPDALLAKVCRVLRRQGSVGIEDGDFSTATVAIGDEAIREQSSHPLIRMPIVRFIRGYPDIDHWTKGACSSDTVSR